MMYWGDNGMSGGDYVLMAASMILFWGLVISGIVLLVRYLGTNGSPCPVDSSPVLRRRYWPSASLVARSMTRSTGGGWTLFAITTRPELLGDSGQAGAAAVLINDPQPSPPERGLDAVSLLRTSSRAQALRSRSHVRRLA